jgi:Tfp pilus assembly protein PilP
MSKLLVLLASVILVACASGDHEDLREWMSTVAQDAKGKIPPLPVVEPYEPVAYDVGDLIDPFKPAKLGSDARKGGSGFKPDLDRPKEPLELYPLESLQYVGVMTRAQAVVCHHSGRERFVPGQDRQLPGAELRRGDRCFRIRGNVARACSRFRR